MDRATKDNGGYKGISYTELYDPYFNNLVFGLTGAGANGATPSTDITGKALTWSGGAAISATQSKFYGSSLYFDGSGDFITTPTVSAFELPGDFMIDFWFWKSADGGYSDDGVISTGSNGNATGGYFVNVSASAGIDFYANSSNIIQYSYNPNTSTWTHCRISRVGSAMKIFVNGASVATATSSVSFGAVGPIQFGRIPSSYDFNGYIQDLRLYKDIGNVSDFTPPIRNYADRARRYPPGRWSA